MLKYSMQPQQLIVPHFLHRLSQLQVSVPVKQSEPQVVKTALCTQECCEEPASVHQKQFASVVEHSPIALLSVLTVKGRVHALM